MIKDFLWAICIPAANFYLNRKYTIHYEGILPKKGPYVLLPKHQHIFDILLEGRFVYQTGRSCSFLMRPFPEPINTFLKLCSGVNVIRDRDGYSTYEKDFKNKRATTICIKRLREGQPLVIHQEGTRKYNAMRPIRITSESPLEKILEAKIPNLSYIPLGIEYENVKKQGSQIWVRAGEPIYTSDRQVLKEYLETELPRLSGINSKDSS
jgi:1-acyl-sn-glycerol-3-phosphate acyltransferase